MRKVVLAIMLLFGLGVISVKGETKIFKQGHDYSGTYVSENGGYRGVVDNAIEIESPGWNGSEYSLASIVGDFSSGATSTRMMQVRFEDIFDPNLVPIDSMITSAKLYVAVLEGYRSPPTAIRLFDGLSSWYGTSAEYSTSDYKKYVATPKVRWGSNNTAMLPVAGEDFSSTSQDVAVDFGSYWDPNNTSTPYTIQQWVSVDVIGDIRNYQRNGSSYGWYISSNHSSWSEGFLRLATSNASSVSWRPYLVIEYVPTTTVIFKQGYDYSGTYVSETGGYQGTVSAATETASPTWNGSGYSVAWIKQDYGAANSNMLFIRFENIFGSGIIPVSAFINDASLELNLYEGYGLIVPTRVYADMALLPWYASATGEYSSSAYRQNVANPKVGWGDANTAGAPISGEDFESTQYSANVLVDMNFTKTPGLYTIDQWITLDVDTDLRCLQNRSNWGWFIGTNHDSNVVLGYRVPTHTASSVLYRPELVVTYSTPPGWVDASTFGFDATDATAALQAAINTGAKTVYVPNMGTDWIIGPIFLVSNQTIEFASGVVVKAKLNGFPNEGDSLFTGRNLDNVTIKGYGATFRMNRQEYDPNDESRIGFRFYSCNNLTIEGMAIKDTGGDGIYLGVVQAIPNKNICIRDVFCDNNYRQGISVISAKNLLIENCILNNTNGAAPQAGLDFEPDASTDVLIDCVVRNCIFQGNYLCGPLWNIMDYMDASTLSGTFENCTIIGSYTYGSKIRRSLPNWTIKDCIFVNNGTPYGDPGVGIYGHYGPTNQIITYSAFYGNRDGASSGYITLGTGCVTNQQPIFVSTDVNDMYYMYLAPNCPTAIKQGASDGGYMGARPLQ